MLFNGILSKLNVMLVCDEKDKDLSLITHTKY